MTEPLVKMLIFVGGLIAGTVAGGLAVRSHFEQLAEEEITEMREYYQQKSERAAGTPDDEYHAKTKKYNKTGSMPSLSRLAKESGAKKDAEDNRVEPWTEMRELSVDSDNKPTVISLDEFGADSPNFYKESITWYEESGDLIDENREQIHNPVNIIGPDALKMLIEDDHEGVIFVRNPELSTDYEITVEGGAWLEDEEE